jgi:hypothetical protein
MQQVREPDIFQKPVQVGRQQVGLVPHNVSIIDNGRTPRERMHLEFAILSTAERAQHLPPNETRRTRYQDALHLA